MLEILTMHSDARPFADVSVIIPAFKAVDTIQRALISVARQDVPPKEVIVVVDGSEDGTYEAARAMEGDFKDTNLKVIAQEKAGAGAARNRGIAEASAKYVAFLDADDEWFANKIKRSIEELENGGHVLIAHDFIRVEMSGNEKSINCSLHFQNAADPYVCLYRKGYIATSSVVAQREVLRTVGGFDETLATAQDFDLWLKVLADQSVTFTIIPEHLTRYHISEGSITSFTARRIVCTLRIAKRYYPKLLTRPGSALMSLCYRVLAVHGEAVAAYRNAGHPFEAFKTLLVSPWWVMKMVLSVPGSTSRAPNWLVAGLWLWVMIGFGAYLYRFQHLGSAFLSMLARL